MTEDSKQGFYFASTPRLEGIHVLLAEDSPDNQLLITTVLKLHGATVDVAADGQEVLRKAQSGNHDVVLMDLQMPLMDGYTATSRLRTYGYSRPIIALSAHAMKEEKDKAFHAGCNVHLAKPINLETLIDTVATYANGSASV